MNCPHVYVLCNRKHEAARYEILKKHLPARGIPLEKIHWVEGPWGSDLTSADAFGVWDPFRPRFGMNVSLSLQGVALSRGELSLMLTFRELLRQVLADGHDKVIVFESDVCLREDFLERLDVLLADPQPWDYISLGEGVGTRPPGCHPSYFSEQKLYKPPHQWVFRCCDSMLFRRSFLEKVWRTFIPFREPLDWEMNVQMMIHRGVPLWADPPLVEPGTARGRFVSSLPT